MEGWCQQLNVLKRLVMKRDSRAALHTGLRVSGMENDAAQGSDSVLSAWGMSRTWSLTSHNAPSVVRNLISYEVLGTALLSQNEHP